MRVERIATCVVLVLAMRLVLAADATGVLAEADRLAADGLWPGFEPRAIPALVHDGEYTTLFRHPAPPEGFEPVPGRADAWRWPGRHPAVVANTSVEFAGTRTATLMQGGRDATPAARAATLLHEMFHVYQRTRQPHWTANEAALFTYPMDDAELLAARRLEMTALRRALAAGASAVSACWARTALDVRRSRFDGMAADAAAYERGTELNEGLATYIEYRALGTPADAVLTVDAFPPDGVRRRAYRAGAALAHLLDRHAQDWQARLAGDESAHLDGLLGEALEGTTACTFETDERGRALAAARADVDALAAHLASERQAFLDRPGVTLHIHADGAPLMLQGFDPLNVLRVGAGEVLHTRMLRLGNVGAEFEMLDRRALSVAAGDHPLFNGVRGLVLTGFQEAPEVEIDGEAVRVQGDGMSLLATRADVEYDGAVLIVRLR